VRKVHAVPRGHQLDREDARADDPGEATPIDLETTAAVQKNIIGNCLCVLGDSMAAPIGSMVEKFREEFDEALERGVPSYSGNGHRAGHAEEIGESTRREADYMSTARGS